MRLQKSIKETSASIKALKQNASYTFEMALHDWLEECSLQYPNISRLITFAALIPPSTAEVERLFSLMKLVKTPIRKRLLPDNLADCIRISKFGKFSDDDKENIMKRWYKERDRKVESFSKWLNYFIFRNISLVILMRYSCLVLKIFIRVWSQWTGSFHYGFFLEHKFGTWYRTKM